MSFVTPMALIICFMFLFIGVLGWRTDRLKPILNKNQMNY